MRFEYQCVLTGGAALAAVLATSGCAPLSPRQIELTHVYRSPELVDRQPQIQRGEPRPILDAVGWAWGIPTKLILWDRRAENHSIGVETEAAIAQYVEKNGLDTVRVRLNQYHPREDWGRLVDNKAVAAPWRYTIGAVSVLGEAILPGRVFGGDHYNAYTNTIHVYSDIPAIALHEAAHAKDFARRKYKGTYAAVYGLPVVPLYHESVASRDVAAYLQAMGTPEEQAAAMKILHPAYGTYVGSTVGTFIPAYSNPVYLTAVLAGHATGRLEARRVLASAPAREDEN